MAGDNDYCGQYLLPLVWLNLILHSIITLPSIETIPTDSAIQYLSPQKHLLSLEFHYATVSLFMRIKPQPNSGTGCDGQGLCHTETKVKSAKVRFTYLI